MEHLLVMIKRSESRMDVYRKALKEFSGKEIYDLDDMDVLEFLMYKDVNDSESGRSYNPNSHDPYLACVVLPNLLKEIIY